MLTRNRTLIAVILVAVVGLVTACALLRQLTGVATADGPGTPPTTVPTTTAPTTQPTSPVSPSPTSKPTLSPTENAVAAAVTNYYKVTDELEQKPPRDPYKKLWTVAKDEAFDMWQDTVLQDVRSQQHQTGWTKVSSIDVGKPNKNKIRVNTCVDVSGIDFVDKQGKSVLKKSRKTAFSYTLLVRKDKGDWFVVQDRDGSKKC